MATAAMIILASIGVALMGLAYTQMFWKQNPTTSTVIAIGLGAGMADGFQAIVHFMLATKYQTIAKDMPLIFDSETPD